MRLKTGLYLCQVVLTSITLYTLTVLAPVVESDIEPDRYAVYTASGVVRVVDTYNDEEIIIADDPGNRGRGSFVALFPRKPRNGLPYFAVTANGLQVSDNENNARFFTVRELINIDASSAVKHRKDED